MRQAPLPHSNGQVRMPGDMSDPVGHHGSLACHDSQLAHGQLEIAGSRRHDPIFSLPRNPEADLDGDVFSRPRHPC